MQLHPQGLLLVLSLTSGLTGGDLQEVSNEVFRERFTPEVLAKAKEVAKDIHAEVERETAPVWAGSYFHGDGMGRNVSLGLAPKAGFTFSWSGCMGVYDRNLGRVEERDGQVLLDCTFPNSRRGFQGIASVLLPVTWGARQYLIDPSDMMGFINDVNGGEEPRPHINGNHFLRVGDEKKPVKGMPQLPARWRGALLAKPISARCTAVQVEFNDAPLTSIREYVFVDLDVGREHGVRQGARFYWLGKGTWCNGLVIELGEKTCTVHLRYLYQDDGLPQAPQLFATRAR